MTPSISKLRRFESARPGPAFPLGRVAAYIVVAAALIERMMA